MFAGVDFPPFIPKPPSKEAMKSILVVGVFLTACHCQLLPSYIKPCTLSDPALTKCLTSTAQSVLKPLKNGIPELNVPTLDPLKVDNIRTNQPSLKVYFTEARIIGLSECRINEIRIEPNKNKIYLNYTKDGSFQAKYQIDGRILIIPITGEGDAKIKFTNLNYFFDIDYAKQKGKDGKDHWKITKHQVSYAAEKVAFKFTNLFGGNKQLADTAHKVVNDNSNLIFQDLSPPIMKKVSRSMINFIDKLLQAIPLEELILS